LGGFFLANRLHLGCQVDCTTKTIIITPHRPEGPRVTGANQLLGEELNVTPATMPAHHRPLTCQFAEA
jgi:hypothetical protein